MLTRLIWKELLEHLMSLRFAISVTLCFFVILCSLFVRVQDYIQVVDDFDQNTAIERQNTKNFRGPWQFQWHGVKVYQRPNPLKIFVRGMENGNGNAAWISGYQEPIIIAATLENPLVALFPSMDMVYFVGVIMSLLAIVFGYDTVSGEKERGTLRLMLSYPIPRDTVLLGKWVGGYLALIIPFLLSLISGALIILSQPQISLGLSDWAKLTGMAGLSLLYIAWVYTAAMAVSCMTSRSSTSVMVLVTGWLIIVLAAPNLAPYTAPLFQSDLPHPQEVEGAKRKAAEDAFNKAYHEPRRQWEKARGIDGAWWTKVNRNRWPDNKEYLERNVADLLFRGEGYVARAEAIARIGDDYQRKLNSASAKSNWIARISPYASYSLACAALTQTGNLGKQSFIRQIRDHQAVLIRYSHQEDAARVQYQIDHEGERPGSWRENRSQPIPEFNFIPPPPSDYIQVVLIDAGILAGGTLFLFMICYMVFIRYDVR